MDRTSRSIIVIDRRDFKKLLCISVVFLAITSGNSRGVPPKDEDVPESQSIVPLTTVGTLRPTFKWAPSDDANLSFELIICAGIYDHHGFWVPGKTVYYRKNITAPTHTVDQSLSPDTIYVWSVRAMSGKRISKWAAYGDSDLDFARKNKARYNAMCAFKTPTK
jgi:hypothetical protein